MNKISRQEMIQMAVETRKKVTSAPVEDWQLNEYPVTMELLHIPTRVGDSLVYHSYQDLDDNMPLIINLHGGGFIRERTASDELFCRKLNYSLNCQILDVDYRVAPEFPFPTALHECYDVVNWAFKHADELNVDPSRIVLMGHSAGGNMVAGINMMAKISGDFKLNSVIMEYPPMDLYTDPAAKAVMGRGIPAERARLYNLYYCEEEQKNPYASPVFAGVDQLTGFPPALMITAGEDSLCAEAEQFAMQVAQAGNEITIKRFMGAGHGFTIYRMNGHEAAFELIERFIRQHI